LISTQGQLDQTRKALDVVEREKVDTVDSANTLEARASTKEAEVYRLRTEEKRLKESLARSASSNQRLAKSCLVYEDTVVRMDEEKVAMRLELADNQSGMESLKEEVSGLEDVLGRERAAKARLEGMCKESEDERERVCAGSLRVMANISEVILSLQLETSLRSAARARDEVDDHLTSVTLEKDSLSDQVGHLKTEMDELKTQLDQVYKESASLNKHRSELEVKVEIMSKEARIREEVVSAARRDKDELQKALDELSEECGKIFFS
jgi:chromosome segregation ATPase